MAIIRKSQARWEGTLKTGNGKMRIGKQDALPFSFASRFEDGHGTNPEELLGAAHAGCFSMALSLILADSGHNPKSVETKAEVKMEQIDGGPKITGIHLRTTVDVPGIGTEEFGLLTELAKTNCVISQAINDAIPITLEAHLVN